MWVGISEVKEHGFRGFLDNQPLYIKDIHHGDPVEFQECHIIDTDLDDPVPPITEKYIKRCFVTNNILHDGHKVGYLYREEPDYEDDSGWRFTAGTETNEYMDDSNNASYISLGAVLRIDDSFIKLLDSDPGVAFIKDEEGNYVEVE